MAIKIPVKKTVAKPKLTPQQIAHQQDYAARHPKHAAGLGIKIPKAPAPPPVTPPPATDPAPTPEVTPPPPTPAGDPSAFFPTARMFEPQNYEGSPLYKFQLQEGQKQVARSLAARGLRDSGTGIQEELDVPLRVAAQDTDRMTRLASENADRATQFANNEALRLERAGNEQWNRQFSLAELMAGQNPFSEAFAGFNTSAGIGQKAGLAKANQIRDAYGRVTASGGGRGGSGGGGSRPTIAAPYPSAPDYSNITPSQIFGDSSSSAGYGKIVSDLLAGLTSSGSAPKKIITIEG